MGQIEGVRQLFYSAKASNIAGESAELAVFSQLKNTFQHEDAFGIHSYPLFYGKGDLHRELDILFGHRDMGIFTIEVKGIYIDDIEKIVGHIWYMRNGFYAKELTPFKQVIGQMYELKNGLNQKFMLGNKVTWIPLVALPNITREQWVRRGFDELLHVPTPIFKEDLRDEVTCRNKIRMYLEGRPAQYISDVDWQRILKLLNVQEPQVFSKQPTVATSSLFSKVYTVSTCTQLKEQLATIEYTLQQGIKAYVFCAEIGAKNICMQHFAPFIETFVLEVFEPSEPALLQDAVYENGQLPDDLIAQLEQQYPAFNAGQFKAIHCAPHMDQMITAGAGTGKTHVMIDRILYLMRAAHVPLKDIIMITFTNASTNEMRKRLEQRFITLFNLTKQSVFLRFAEDVKLMNISTIHAYAKSIIQNLAHELGYGQAIQLRSFTYEKKQIIEQLINDYFDGQSVLFFKKHRMKHYQFIQFVYDMWEEMEKKGLSREEIQTLDWGIPTETAIDVGALLTYIFARCEHELDRTKKRLNAVTMGDLIRKLKYFTNSPDKLTQLKQNCFMFVDEFQDSDDVQISFIAQLQKIANYKLFVVGDTKQSIYRFRGADYRSFDVLAKKRDQTKPLLRLSLRHNYRSSQAVLSNMDRLFTNWGAMEPPLLNYDENARLVTDQASHYPNHWLVDYVTSANNEPTIEKRLKEVMKEIKGTDKQLALLVRTNYQAKKMKDICNRLHIATLENLDGTFFKSDAVQHFKSVIEMLLYPNEPKFVITGLDTPYFRVHLTPQQFMRFNGDKTAMNQFLAPIKETYLSKYTTQLRENAVMAVMQMIIYDYEVLAYIQDYYRQQQMTEEQAKLEALRYIANLQHLMKLIERQFHQQNLSLHMLNNWLTLHKNTNRTENEPILESTDAQVTITTVHRAKGLEFDTVMIPVTNQRYNAVQSQFYIEEEVTSGARRIGWSFKEAYTNNHFNALNDVEIVEQQKEEARLLYVALTRAKQKVIINMPVWVPDYTWAKLLELANLKGE